MVTKNTHKLLEETFLVEEKLIYRVLDLPLI